MEFYKIGPQLEDPPTASNIFNLDPYLTSLSEANKPFMKELVKTQQFTTFIERSYVALRSYNELSYFVRGVRKLQSGSRTKFVEDLKKIYNKLIFNYNHVTLVCLTDCVACCLLARRLLRNISFLLKKEKHC